MKLCFSSHMPFFQSSLDPTQTKDNMHPFFPSVSRPQLQDRRSFHRLRSLHLTATTPEATPKHSPKALSISTDRKPHRKRSGYSVAMSRIDPETIPPIFWLGLMVIVSIIFVVALATTFRGVQLQKPYFKDILDDAAMNNPGVSGRTSLPLTLLTPY